MAAAGGGRAGGDGGDEELLGREAAAAAVGEEGKPLLPDAEQPGAASDDAGGDGGGGVASLRPLFIRLAVTFIILLAACVVVQHYVGHYVQEYSRVVVSELGVTGCALAIFVLDVVPQPLSFVPLLYVAVEGGENKWVLWAAGSAGSVAAGNVGYLCGQCVGLPARAERWLTEQFPQVRASLDSHGNLGVALVALLPIPFGLATWPAGAFPLQYCPGFFFATLLRVLKVGMYTLSFAAAAGDADAPAPLLPRGAPPTHHYGGGG